jgi:hypothetical protein
VEEVEEEAVAVALEETWHTGQRAPAAVAGGETPPPPPAPRSRRISLRRRRRRRLTVGALSLAYNHPLTL